jgi:cell wall-associated NlpC family hydrolase
VTRRRSTAAVLALVAGLILLAAAAVLVYLDHGPATGSTASEDDRSAAATGGPVDPATLTFARHTDPARTVAEDADGDPVAVFTDGARTARLTGPVRTFTEPGFTKRSVITDAWIRLVPTEWRAGAENESWFTPWLTHALSDSSPDVFGAAMDYINGAPDRKDDKGVRYAGDAAFGPVSATDPDGREERSDFLDYLGVSWTFPDGGTKQPQNDRYGDVDCSGFLRLVYGYRMGYPLRITNDPGPGLPRRAYAIASVGPGIVVIANKGVPVTDFRRLQPGDLVFFDTALGDGSNQTDHSGIYLGMDDAGHYRFISSRSRANGPTLGDRGGDALLDGGGYWSIRFRTARRI